MWNIKGLRAWAIVLAAAMLLTAFAGCRQDEKTDAVGFDVIEASPAQDETGVSVAVQSVALTFSQAVRSVDVNLISLCEKASGKMIAPGSAEIVANGVFLNIGQRLEPETAYTMRLMSGAAVALTGALSEEYSLNFTTGGIEDADTQPPVLIQTYPENNGVDFDPNGELILLFDEPVMSAAQFNGIKLTDSSGSKCFTEANISGSRLCIRAKLSVGEAYTLSVPASAVQDYAMNPYSEQIELAFSTAKQTVPTTETAPRLVATVPRNGVTKVSTGSLISVIFDAELQQGSAWKNISVVDSNGKNCLTNAKTDKKELQLSAKLKSGEKYKVTVPKNAVKNAAGIAAEAVSFSFTTAADTVGENTPSKDVQPPKVVLTVPTANASAVQVFLPELRIRFDENIINGSAFLSTCLEAQGGKKAEIRLSVGGNTLTAKIAKPLAGNTSYTFLLPAGAVEDMHGNALSSAFKLSFKTGKSGLPGLPTAPIITDPATTVPPTLPEPTTTVPEATVPQTVTIAGETYSTDIKELTITDRPIGDMSGFGKLKKLEKLTLSGTELTDISALAALGNLRELNLEMNRIRDISAIASMPRLETLTLRFNAVTDISPLKNLTKLKKLIVSDNDITDISALRSLSGLTYLSMTNNMIDDISSLSGLSELKYLAAEFNRISDVSPLAHLNKLETLCLSKNLIADASPLGSLAGLKELLVSSNQISSTNGLESLNCLESLYISDNPLQQSRITALKNALPGCNIVF